MHIHFTLRCHNKNVHNTPPSSHLPLSPPCAYSASSVNWFARGQCLTCVIISSKTLLETNRQQTKVTFTQGFSTECFYRIALIKSLLFGTKRKKRFKNIKKKKVRWKRWDKQGNNNTEKNTYKNKTIIINQETNL